MILLRHFDRIGLGGFLVFGGLLLLPLSIAGQESGVNTSGASNCTIADFDTNLSFANEPNKYYAIIVNKRNISSHPCAFDAPMYGPTFYPDRVSGDRPFALCYDGENRLANGQYPLVRPVSLAPGQIVRQEFRWKTSPPSEAIRCLQPKWMSGPAMLVAPSLIKQICSDIEVSRFTLVPNSDSAATEAQANGVPRVRELKLSSDKGTYYAREGFSLRVVRTENSVQTPAKPDRCPVLYLRERSPNGATRIDEVHPLAFKGCSGSALGYESGDWESGFEVDSGANSRWEGMGEHVFAVSQLAGSTDDSQIRFLSSNDLRVQIADPSLIQRRWERAKGVGADITLDKDTYGLGEDVPLHLAIQDFDADVTLYTWDPLWDPCMVVGIEVQDAAGHPLPVNERFPDSSICTGHGFGPKPFAKGKVVPLERKLRAEGWLPNHPGTYTIVLT
ncbi:MAG: hypothetical protein WCA20_24195, partial [Candidatus Sulfotelmatobacter sp.]